jgi:hypothetical protein
MSIQPLQFLLLVFAGWVNRKQLEVIDYLKEENRVLREQLDGRRPRFSDDQRRRLAAHGKVLGLRRLREVTYLLTLKAHLRFTPGEGESFRQATLNGTHVWVQVQPGQPT